MPRPRRTPGAPCRRRALSLIISAAAPSSALPGRGQVSDAIPDDLPERELLRDHRELGWISLVGGKERRRLCPSCSSRAGWTGRAVPVMDVMFCRGAEEFRRCARGAGALFPAARRLGFLMDGDMATACCRTMSRARSRATSRGRIARSSAISPIPRKSYSDDPARQLATRTAAQVLVDQLRIQGVTHVFCVPGESYLPVLDALHDSGIAVTVCRNEGGASMMAEAYGKQTGRPGICLRHPRPRRHQRLRRHPYRAAGFHAHDSVRGPGGARLTAAATRSRKWITAPSSAAWPSGWREVERTRPNGRDGRPRLCHRAWRGAAGRWCCHCPMTCCRCRRNLRDMPVCRQRWKPSQAADEMAALEESAGQERTPDADPWRQPLERGRAAARLPASRNASACRSQPLSAAHIMFDPLHPNYAGDLGLGANPRLVARVKASDLVIAAGASV